MSGAGGYKPAQEDGQVRIPKLCVIDENGREIQHKSSSHPPSRLSHRYDSRTIDLSRRSDKPGQFLSPDCPLQQLKAVADRLNLSLRRKSTPDFKRDNLISNDDTSYIAINEDNTKRDWKSRIDDAIDWLYTELADLRSQDAHLAREFLTIRQEIHQIKLQKSCEEHREMLDEAAINVEESHLLNDVSDLPDYAVDTSLRQLGVMRMHLNSRRFSTC